MAGDDFPQKIPPRGFTSARVEKLHDTRTTGVTFIKQRLN
jgi:hypothetical protein